MSDRAGTRRPRMPAGESIRGGDRGVRAGRGRGEAHATIRTRSARLACLAVASFMSLGLATAQDAALPMPDCATASPRLCVEVYEGFVSVQSRDVELREVLDALAVRTDLVLVAPGRLEGHLTLELGHMPLHEALKRILRGRSFLLEQPQARRPGERAAGRLWIFPQAPDGATAGRRSGSARTIDSLEARLIGGSVGARLEAVRNASTLQPHEALRLLGVALADRDARVRVRAVYALAALGGDRAVGSLAAALGDENVGVREEAAYALGELGGEAADRLLLHALRDSDPGVREVAMRALDARRVGPRQAVEKPRTAGRKTASGRP